MVAIKPDLKFIFKLRIAIPPLNQAGAYLPKPDSYNFPAPNNPPPVTNLTANGGNTNFRPPVHQPGPPPPVSVGNNIPVPKPVENFPRVPAPVPAPIYGHVNPPPNNYPRHQEFNQPSPVSTKVNVNNKTCKLCNLSKDPDEFTAIVCGDIFGCQVCSACRGKTPAQCTVCHRFYSNYEKELIGILNLSYV